MKRSPSRKKSGLDKAGRGMDKARSQSVPVSPVENEDVTQKSRSLLTPPAQASSSSTFTPLQPSRKMKDKKHLLKVDKS